MIFLQWFFIIFGLALVPFILGDNNENEDELEY